MPKGWGAALQRLREEARAAGANAVLERENAHDSSGRREQHGLYAGRYGWFTSEGLPPSTAPIVATVPALEFVKLLEADVVPTGIAIGAHYEWMNDWRRSTNFELDGQYRIRRIE